jgi:tetratricopeptide (TPR) repeat protein
MTTIDEQDIRHRRQMAEVDAALARNDYAGAALLAKAATDDGLRHPKLLSVLAFSLFEARRPAEALPLLDEADAMTPGDPHILHGRACCLADVGRRVDALIAFDKVLGLRPGFAPSHFQKARVLASLNDPDAAARAYELAIACDPNFADALGERAFGAARQGQLAQARDLAGRALAIAPNLPVAHISLAIADFTENRLDEAGERIRTLLADPLFNQASRPSALSVLGDVLDRQRRYDEAFEAYAESKRLSHVLAIGSWVAGASEALMERFERLLVAARRLDPWKPPSSTPSHGGGAAGHVFLVGFPRSGTTLLEQVLASHPSIVTLEERLFLRPAEEAFMTDAEGLSRLEQATDDDLEPFRAMYWQDVADRGLDVRGKILIDKLPLASLLLPVIGKIFPGSKVLFAQRDPRDVVLSCFRRSFGFNPAMHLFTTLPGAAAFYDRAMALATEYRRIVPTPLHLVRHEAFVADFEGRGREICDFIGVEWDDAMKEFASAAASRTINTPSAPQVRRGLNSEGIGHWRHYRQSLAPILPVLAPWVQRMGYEPDSAA